MTVKRLTRKQWGHWCSYCMDGGKARASFRGCNFERFACEEHYDVLAAEDAKHEAQQARWDSYQTEGEYQAMRSYRSRW